MHVYKLFVSVLFVLTIYAARGGTLGTWDSAIYYKLIFNVICVLHTWDKVTNIRMTQGPSPIQYGAFRNVLNDVA